MELVGILTQQLGINTQQASGGLGLLMGVAQTKLGSSFGQIAGLMPGVENLIAQAPKAETTSAATGGSLGAVSGLLGGKGGAMGSLGSLASLAGGFQQLGLKPDMIGKFVPVILNFVQSKGGDASRTLLEKVAT